MNYYEKAIEILTRHEEKAYKILIEVAKKNPACVVHAFEKIDSVLNKQDWIGIVRPIAEAGEKILAIKKCREITGYGLKEAKEAVEKAFGI